MVAFCSTKMLWQSNLKKNKNKKKKHEVLLLNVKPALLCSSLLFHSITYDSHSGCVLSDELSLVFLIRTTEPNF